MNLLRDFCVRLLVLGLAWFKYRKRPPGDPDWSAKVTCLMVFVPILVLLLSLVQHYFAPEVTKDQTPYVYYGVLLVLGGALVFYVDKIYDENRSLIYSQAEAFVRSRENGPVIGISALFALIVGQFIVYKVFTSWLYGAFS